MGFPCSVLISLPRCRKNIATILHNENKQWIYVYWRIQCENKFKELRKKYCKVKDHDKQSGNNPITCKFFDKFEKILGDKPYVQPVALASNLKKRPKPPMSSSQKSNIENTSDKDEYDKKKKVKKTRAQKELGE